MWCLFHQQKKVKDAGAPKRPMSAYMLWLNANRERIKSENPGISVTEISKKAGEMWKQIDKSRKEVCALSHLQSARSYPDTAIGHRKKLFCNTQSCYKCCNALLKPTKTLPCHFL